MDIYLRTIEEKDIETVYEMLKKLYNYTQEKGFLFNINEKSVIINILRQTLDSEYDRIIVAEVDSQVVGFVNFCISEINPKFVYTVEGFIGNIVEIFIEEEFRNKNIGTLLIGECEEFFHMYDVKVVQINAAVANTDAIKFYEKRGFRNDCVSMIKNY